MKVILHVVLESCSRISACMYMCTSSCVYEQCMYTCYYSLPNCSEDEDVFGDASLGKACTKHRPSKDQAWTKQRLGTDVQEKRENFDLSVGLTVDTWELLSSD